MLSATRSLEQASEREVITHRLVAYPNGRDFILMELGNGRFADDAHINADGERVAEFCEIEQIEMIAVDGFRKGDLTERQAVLFKIWFQ